MKSFGIYERTFATLESINLAKKFLSEQGLLISIRSIGGLIQTTHCELIYENKSISNGSGKGIGMQSEASALFEAIEHLYSIYPHVPENMPIKKLDLDNVDSELDKGSPDFKLFGQTKDLYFSRILFKNILDNNEELWFPYFLTDPYFKASDKRELDSINSFSLLRYATNSGTATGVSSEDAILHALLETIERDAIGIELLRTVVSKRPLPVRKLSQNCFDSGLTKLINHISLETSGVITAWDITTDLKIPVCLVGIKTKSEELFFGSGASLSMEYAIERAALEALQYFHAGAIGLRPKQMTKSQKFTLFPVYYKCYLRKGIFTYKGGETILNSLEEYNTTEAISSSTKAQIDFIVKRLEKLGLKVFVRPILDNLIKVYQVVIPKLERFHLVSYGVPVIPGYRGNDVIKKLEGIK